MKRRYIPAVCLVAALAACGQGGDGNEQASSNTAVPAAKAERGSTIGEALSGSPDYSAFRQALQSAGLLETLRGVGPYTVFAPTDAAFAALPEAERGGSAEAEQRERLVQRLSYHIVPGTVTEADLRRALERGQGRAELATMTGDTLSLSREGDAILIGGGGETRARLTQADQLHSNGVTHGVDAVLTPPDPGS